MKSKKIYIFLIALILTLSFNKLSSHADTMAEVIADMYGDSSASTITMKHGCTTDNQGWLCYIVGPDGHVAYNPIFFYKTGGYITPSKCNPVQLTSRVDSVNYIDSVPTYEWPDPYYNSGSKEGLSNAENVKQWMCQKSENGTAHIYDVIGQYWGQNAAAAFASDDNYYFIMEPVFWHGLHKKINGSSETRKFTKSEREAIAMEYCYRIIPEFRNLPPNVREKHARDILYQVPEYQVITKAAGWELIGDYCGTVYNGAKYETLNPNVFVGVYDYRHKVYPNVMKAAKDYKSDNGVVKWLKGASSSGTISNPAMVSDGYGIGVLWNRDKDFGGPGDPEDVPYDESYKPVALYETKNYDSTYNISEAIPSSEDFTNEINCASFVGDGNFIATTNVQSGTRWSASVTYYWTEEITHHTDGYYTRDYLGHANTKEEIAAAKASGKVVENGNIYTKDYWVKPRDWSTYQNHTIDTQVYKFSASLNYQYIKETPHIYTWESAYVNNNAFENGILYYDKSNSEAPSVISQMKLWNNGNGKETIVSTNAGETTKDVLFKGSQDHYGWAGGLTASTVCIGKAPAHKEGTVCSYPNMNNDKANAEAQALASYAATIQSNTWSRNDYLLVKDKKISAVICDDTKVSGCNVTSYKGNNVYASYSSKDAASYAGYQNNLEKINEALTTARVHSKQVTDIPYNCDNGDWVTGMTVTYRNIYGNGAAWVAQAGKSQYGANAESIYKHVMRDGVLSGHTGVLLGDEADGYPVRVHTPIEAPIKIVDYKKQEVNEANQLISGYSLNTRVDNELLLDKSYFIEWDSELWTSNIYGEVQGYEDIFDKYVLNKYLKFPFDVVYNNTIYKANNTDGYTDWITVSKPTSIYTDWESGVSKEKYESANHWQMTPFYIPTFAIDCGTPENEVWVECKVEAINVHGKFNGDHSNSLFISSGVEMPIDGNGDNLTEEHASEMPSYSQNSDKANYVAVCSKKVQLSGWVYDFSIVGIDNKAVYTGEGLDDIDLSNNWWAMADVRQELKTGLKSRTGSNWIRFLNDGYVQDTLNQHQFLPLRDGESFAYAKMGDLWKSSKFAFTLKTIGDFNGAKDKIDIAPSYTYVRSDGSVLNSGDFWYVERETETSSFNVYDPSKTDVSGKWANSFKLGDKLFLNSYYDSDDNTNGHFGDWVNTSVETENRNNGATVYPYTVDYQEYLNRDILSYTISHITLPSEARYISGEYEQLERNDGKMYDNVSPYSMSNYGTVEVNEFIQSMQHWNGEFMIPSKIRIIDKAGKESFNTFEDYLTYLTETEGGYSWNDESLFEPLDGRMIVNFDIYVSRSFCNDCGKYCDEHCSANGHNVIGKPYLHYNGAGGGGLDMWARQGYDVNVEPGLPLREGDVVIVDTDRKIGDYFSVGIFNIN